MTFDLQPPPQPPPRPEGEILRRCWDPVLCFHQSPGRGWDANEALGGVPPQQVRIPLEKHASVFNLRRFPLCDAS